MPKIWRTDEEVADYIIECYAGVEFRATKFNRKVPYYAFIWEEDDEVWVGNSVAFANHVARAFNFVEKDGNFWNVQRVLRQVGERIHDKIERTATGNHPGTYIPPERKRKVEEDR